MTSAEDKRAVVNLFPASGCGNGAGKTLISIIKEKISVKPFKPVENFRSEEIRIEVTVQLGS